MSIDEQYRILQIIPAEGWWYEDRGAFKYLKRTADSGPYGYHWTHEPLIAWALCEVTGLGSGEKWTAVLGLIRSDVDEFVDPNACFQTGSLSCDETERNGEIGCQHWQSLPVPVVVPPSSGVEGFVQ